MRLVTFTRNNVTHIGKLVGQDSVVDLTDAGLPASLIALLEGGASLLKQADQVTAGKAVSLSSVKLLAPIPRPGKIICIGLNYRDHAAETGQAIPQFPIVFAKW